MGTYFTWPWKRKEYAGIGNPRFVSDIVSDNELALEGLKNLLGLSDTDFAIVYGLEYVVGTSNSYNPGVIFFNGSFYAVESSFVEGLRLTPNVTDTMPQPFNDGNSRNIYTKFSTVTTTNPTGSTPVFTGNMNGYRLNLNILNQDVSSIFSVLSTLGNAAFKNVGTTPGTVAAGDASYSKTDSDNKYVDAGGDTMTGALVLPADPTADMQAATKHYVDNFNSAGAKMVWFGTVASDGSVVKLAGSLAGVSVTHLSSGKYRISHSIGSTNYFAIPVGTSGNENSPRCIVTKNPTAFDVYGFGNVGLADMSFELTIWTF